jgi:hypothetical protein
MLQIYTILTRLWELMIKLGIIQSCHDFHPTCMKLVKTIDDPYYDDENKDDYSGPIWF